MGNKQLYTFKFLEYGNGQGEHQTILKKRKMTALDAHNIADYITTLAVDKPTFADHQYVVFTGGAFHCTVKVHNDNIATICTYIDDVTEAAKKEAKTNKKFLAIMDFARELGLLAELRKQASNSPLLVTVNPDDINHAELLFVNLTHVYTADKRHIEGRVTRLQENEFMDYLKKRKIPYDYAGYFVGVNIRKESL